VDKVLKHLANPNTVHSIEPQSLWITLEDGAQETSSSSPSSIHFSHYMAGATGTMIAKLNALLARIAVFTGYVLAHCIRPDCHVKKEAWQH